MELGISEIEGFTNKGIPYTILVEDLTSYYKSKFERELPLAKSQLEAKKAQSQLASKSLSTKSTEVDNLIQYEGCSEVNWAVPTNFNLGTMGGCLTYSEMLAELDEMRSLYPNLISVKTDASPGTLTHGNSFTNGGVYDSWAGQPVYYVRISDNPDTDESNEPESLYSGMTHSREVSSMMNLIYYMWYVLENYDSDAGIKNLIDNHEMYFIPVANPDGLMWNEQIAPSGGGMQRKNLGPYNTGNNAQRGVDLNRNYNYFWGSNPIYGGSSGSQSSDIYRGPTAFSEPETQIVRNFSATREFKTAMNHHATSNLIPHAYNGYPAAPASGREAEYNKFCHDLTRFNRYIYGEAPDILTVANGDMSDWMLGGIADVNGSTGSGKQILALAPENGSWQNSDGEGGFWPNATKIVEIAQRAVRMNFVNAYHSGKFVQFHDLNTSNITTINGDLEFGLEYLGQTLGDITLNVTPVSSNITSITPPITQSGWSKLEQRTVTAAYTLNSGIQPNDEIEFQITLSNDDGYVMYKANIIKYYNPTLLFSYLDTDSLTTNWSASGGSWNITNDAYSGSTAITDSPGGSYNNSLSNQLTLNSGINLSSSSNAIVQFYAKWDLERNFDYVQFQGSTDGTNWVTLCGKYTKPGSSISTNRYSSSNSTNTNAGKTTADQNNQPTGSSLYDGNSSGKWVMEEIAISASENNFLLGANNARFRFVFDSDATNRADGYSTTFDGFVFDDFKVISIQVPCTIVEPTGVVASNITTSDASITWNNVPSATYDLRYKETSSSTWVDVSNLSSITHNLTGLSASTQYEVQVRSKCSGGGNSAYSTSVNFSTTDVQLNYCASASTNINDEYISRVQLNTIDNTSGAQFYSDFTGISTTLTKGSQYTITVTPTWTGTVYNEAYSVWIDYNRDGDFTDSGEQVFSQGNTQATSVSGSFTIPSSAVENSTRMRVSMKYNALPTSCETFQYGEVEDYTIVIEGSEPDVTAPVITLNGNSTINLFVGDTYAELGATATDNIDGNLTSSIVIGGTVNTSLVGTYTVTYNVSDAAGNDAIQVNRTINVATPPDTTAPVITLNGNSTINLNVGDAYTEQGATATDNIDGDITANIVTAGTVDTNTAGTYFVTYNVSDAAGNNATPVIRTVNVIADTTAPIITLIGASTININVGDSYTEQGATATDNIDGNLTSSIVTTGNVNTALEGTYTVNYNVSDAAGNNATQVSRTVNVILPDTTAPVITLNGNSVIDLFVSDTYTELGATATDNIDGNLTSSIVIGGTVNTSLVGTYTVTYNVSDAAGNNAIQVTRTINVATPPDTTAPVITLNGNSTINLNVGDAYTEQGATATDNIDGN
ncbi:MAG: hypothetical protein COA67_08835, partial [Lutibacter sp.]